MRKILSAILCMTFIFIYTACSPAEDSVQDMTPEDKNEQVFSEKNEVTEDREEDVLEKENETDTWSQTIAFTPDCTTCKPYIYGDKQIIIGDGKLLLSGFDGIEVPVTEVNCFVYNNYTRLVFTDSEVYAFPDCEYTRTVFTESGMDFVTESIEKSPLFEALSVINSTDTIRHVSPQILYGDTMELPGIYVFTKSGKCSFVDNNGAVIELSNVSFIIDENGHTVTLFSDGTVEDNYFSDETESWTNVCFIDTNRTDGYGITVGVKTDGKLLLAGEYSGDKTEIELWTNVVSAVVINDMEKYYPIALTSFGTLLVPSDCKLAKTASKWSNIIEIGLTSPDGTFWARTADGEFLFA